jgi:SAM-dependent methyltransferase
MRKIMEIKLTPTIVVDEKYGYKKLYPVPSEEELRTYYAEKYYDLKLDKPAAKESNDKKWLGFTMYADIVCQLALNNCKTVLEIGCGVGNLMEMLEDNGFNVFGVEPSKQAEEEAWIKGLNVANYNLNGFVKKCKRKFDAIIMINVLEHVENPFDTLEKAKTLLKPGGLLVVQVPNDFNILQEATGKEPWWVVAPDHINYFNRESLNKLLYDLEFSVYLEQSDFPMELYILAGYDYISKPGLGKQCHEERKDFEFKSSMRGIRSRLYQLFAKAGIGRNILTFSRLEQC